MGAEIKIEKKENYLLITSVGVREQFDDVVKATQKIYELAKINNAKLVLLDCNNLVYNGIFYPDAFNIVRYYEKHLGDFKDITISVVANASNFELLKYWESICEKRGYNIRVFTDKKNATDWLLSL